MGERVMMMDVPGKRRKGWKDTGHQHDQARLDTESTEKDL